MKACFGSCFLVSVLTISAAPRAARADDAPLARRASSEDVSWPSTTSRIPTSVPRRTVGEVLTIAGLIHLAAGTLAIAAVGVETKVHPECSWIGDDLMGCPMNTTAATLIAGVPNLVTGLGLTLAGIPLWMSGAKKRDAALAIQVGASRVSVAIPF